MSKTVLVIFIVATKLSGLSIASLEDAAKEVLGPNSDVRIERIDQKREDEELVEDIPNADGVVELWWTDETESTIFLHSFVKERDRWVDRQITFDPQDEERERGRTIGFALGSMLDAERSHPPPSEPPEPEPPPAPPPPILDRPSSIPKPETDQHFALGLAGTLALGINGQASAGGASGHLELELTRPLWLRVGASTRFGEITEAQATSRDIMGFLGLAWRPWAHRDQPLTMGLVLDMKADWLTISHFSEDDPAPDAQSRFLPLAMLQLEGEARLSGNTGIFLGVAGEFAFGTTEIRTRNQEVATVPVARVVGQAGLRALF